MLLRNRLSGMFGFTIVWLAQIISVLASLMTQFALTIWVFDRTGSVTALGLAQVFFLTPFLLLSPLAGAMVDRYSRKQMMAVSDVAAGISTIAVLILQYMGKLEVWHLYAAAVVNGSGNTFQWPAYSAAISTMVPKEQYGRANGMMSLIEGGPNVIAPLLAGALLPLIDLTGILLLDVVTFPLALCILAIVHIPQPKRTQEGMLGTGSIWKEALYGFRYIFARRSLFHLQMIFFFGNISLNTSFTLLTPMILSRTGNDSISLGLVQSAGAIGGVVGSVVMSIWAGFKRRVNGVLLGWIFLSLFGSIVLGIGQVISIWVVAAVIGAGSLSLLSASNQSIWQAKVAPDMQGRVFSARRLIAWLANPITPLVAGTLADHTFEPAMRASSRLSHLFGWLVGIGPGAGMALLMVFAGIGGVLVGISGYFIFAIRNVEDLLPDHDVSSRTEMLTG